MSKAKTVSASSLAYSSNLERPETNLVTLEVDDMKRVHSVKNIDIIIIIYYLLFLFLKIFGEKTRKGYTPLVLVPKKSSKPYRFFSM